MWEEERLGSLAILVDMGYVETSEETVAPSAGEDDPSGVGTPIVETLGIVAVES